MSLVSHAKELRSSITVEDYDVVIVGAGPYGLSTAAHLLERGLRVAIFGKPLNLWREHMPQGMYLRSHWRATSLSAPGNKYLFEDFLRASSNYKLSIPVPIQAFIDYGLWFQKLAVPNLDETYVSSIKGQDGRFVLTLADGRIIHSPSVIVAPGLYYYARRPVVYDGFPPELVSHTVEHADFHRFAGQEVVVVGGGQAAVESAALLYEAGAAVQLITRGPIHWLGPDLPDKRSFWEQLRIPTAGIAPGWRNLALEHLPYLFYHVPQGRKDHIVRTSYGPAASDWLRERVIGKVNLHEGVQIQKVHEVATGIEVLVSANKSIKANHVLLATGYHVDIKRIPMLDPSLLASIRTHMGAPVLNSWFESSVPGLYFIGITSLQSFGPLYRFVVGTKAAAQRVAAAAGVRYRVTRSRK
jgi:thioredoxin reductase